MYIGGYKSGNDTHANVSFERVSDTGTGFGLPTGYESYDHLTIPARLLTMKSYIVERIGAFSCIANKNGVQENIITIIMAQNSKLHYWKKIICQKEK